MRMAKYKFDVHYEGPGLENNSIPIRDLAPSLLALSDAFQTIQSIKNPGEAPLSLNISATKKGSFIAELLLVNGQDLFKQAMDLLNSDQSQALINLIEYASIFSGVVGLLKKGITKIKSVIEKENNKVELTLEDNTKLEIDKDVFVVYKNAEFRKNINSVIQPLNKQGIDSITFSASQETNINVKITKDEVEKFDVPDTKEKQLDSNELEVYLQIINVAFEHGKWKFSEGNNTSQFFADIEDEDFLESVQKNKIQFGSTDTLKVKLRKTQYLDKSGALKTDYTIVKVLQHIKGAEEIELDLYSDDK